MKKNFVKLMLLSALLVCLLKVLTISDFIYLDNNGNYCHTYEDNDISPTHK